MSEIMPVASFDEPANTPPSPQFAPNARERNIFGSYTLHNPALILKPHDVPDDHVAYNPSSIWTIKGKKDVSHDVMYVRVEPNRSSPETSHLGKAVVRPYIVDVKNPNAPLLPYYDASEIVGEDAALTRVNRRLQNGKLEEIWLLSCVDPKPKADKQNDVHTLCTRFYAGSDLSKLEHIADGPEWMKDIRIAKASGPLGTELELYGRPQPMANSGNITHTTINSIEDLNSESIMEAKFIHDSLLPIGSGVWGGVNDVIRVGVKKYVLAAHRAWRTGDDGNGRHYESVLFGHNALTNRIVELGVIATADKFPQGTVKDDTEVDLTDVVFTGGGYNGGLEYVSFGVRDGSLGIAGLRRADHTRRRKAA